jgi:hypothetical protein
MWEQGIGEKAVRVKGRGWPRSWLCSHVQRSVKKSEQALASYLESNLLPLENSFPVCAGGRS